jgi:autotransporter-associated beta strand protein
MFMNGGSLTVYNAVTVGDQNNALLQITAGTMITGNVQLGNTVWDTSGNPTIYTGTLQLNGGVLQTSEVVQGGGSPGSWTTGSVWSWGNGTLQASLQGMNITAPATLTGTATLDTNGQSVNMSGVLSGTGSLTKIGTGVATMIRTDSYSGGTIINAGALKAHTNGSFGSGTITINVVDGLQVQTGLTVANTIIDHAGANEFVDVPDTGASATLSGNISLQSQTADQYRLGISGSNASLTLTGASTVATATSIITRGNIIFAQNGSLNVASNNLTIGRFNSTSNSNFTVNGNATVSANGITLGGLNGSSDDLNTNVTLTGNGTMNARTFSVNLDNSATANDTVTLNLAGTSDLFTSGFIETSTASGRIVVVNLNGGTLNATTNDPVGGFFPSLANTTVTVQTGGAIINNGGFNVTLATPLLGSTGDGGFTGQGAGTTTLSGANTFTGPFSVTAGTVVLGSTGALPASRNVSNGASLVVAANTTAGNISGSGSTTVNAGVSLTASTFNEASLTNNGTTQINGPGVVGPITGSGTLIVGTGTSNNTLQIAQGSGLNQQNSLVINAGSSLDLTNNRLVINYGSGPDPITTIAGYLASGFNGGTWNGTGINSSTAVANSLSYGLGYADSADAGNPAGLASGTIEVEYTLLGDANLDRAVNGVDFGILAANFNKGVTAWDQGDFNYDGIVNGVDFADLAANFNQGANGAAGASAADFAALDAFAAANGLLADVPEPATITAGLALIGSLQCRPRRLRKHPATA